jgi:hypothetical protein
MPAFPLHGSSFKKGVRFSVQTTSCGRTPCISCRFGNMDLGCVPSGSKILTGLIVRVESMKLRLAQNNPDSAFVKVNHREVALFKVSCRVISKQLEAYSWSDCASTQAHNSTPVPPSLAPCHGLAPQFSASHRPTLKRK